VGLDRMGSRGGAALAARRGQQQQQLEEGEGEQQEEGEAARPAPDALALPAGCPEPGGGAAAPTALLLVHPFEQGCGLPAGSTRSCGQFNNILASLLQALA
jgi:hypothetical protein